MVEVNIWLANQKVAAENQSPRNNLNKIGAFIAPITLSILLQGIINDNVFVR